MPHNLQNIVLRCLEMNPDRRFANAERLAQALESSQAAHGWSRFLAARWWAERCFSGTCHSRNHDTVE